MHDCQCIANQPLLSCFLALLAYARFKSHSVGLSVTGHSCWCFSHAFGRTVSMSVSPVSLGQCKRHQHMVSRSGAVHCSAAQLTLLASQPTRAGAGYSASNGDRLGTPPVRRMRDGSGGAYHAAHALVNFGVDPLEGDHLAVHAQPSVRAHRLQHQRRDLGATRTLLSIVCALDTRRDAVRDQVYMALGRHSHCIDSWCSTR